MATRLNEGSDDDLYIVPEAFVYHYDKISQYGWFTISLLLATWAFANGVDMVMQKTEYLDIGKKYKLLAVDKRKNTVTYVVQIVMTTVALICQIYGGWEVVFQFKDETSGPRTDWFVLAVQIFAVLYVWEILYRLSIGLPLLIHHLMALLVTQLGAAALLDTGDMFYTRLLCLFGLHGTTEQLSFISLFVFRLDLFPSWQATLFYVSAVQTLVFKLALTAAITALVISEACIDYETDGMGWLWFWRIAYFPITIPLLGSQLYAVKILFALGERCQEMAEDDASNEASDKEDGESIEDIEEGSVKPESADFTCIDRQDDDIAPAGVSAKTGRQSTRISKRVSRERRRRESNITLASYESSAPLEQIILDDFSAQLSIRLAEARSSLSVVPAQRSTSSGRRKRRPTFEIARALSQLEMELGMEMEVGEDDSEALCEQSVGDDMFQGHLTSSELAHVESLFLADDVEPANDTDNVSRLSTISDAEESADSTTKSATSSGKAADVVVPQ